MGKIALRYHVNRDRTMYGNDFKYQAGDMLGYSVELPLSQ